ncbi:MAG: CHRD domain-containing protein [Bacteroidota bacterium]|nr:CHRD domain-containing protein [Bacteroidota bacterium]
MNQFIFSVLKEIHILNSYIMKKHLLLLVLVISLVFASCNKVDSDVELQDELVLKKGTVVQNFAAHLTGDQEVPPRETLATGQAIFKLSKDGTELSYKLIVANLENLHMAHIHLAPAGTNGGVVVWLYPSGFPPALIPGKTNGILAQGVITNANLVGALAGQTLTDLIAHFNNGNAYVNVHTSLYPGGEIRGQIK